MNQFEVQIHFEPSAAERLLEVIEIEGPVTLFIGSDHSRIKNEMGEWLDPISEIVYAKHQWTGMDKASRDAVAEALRVSLALGSAREPTVENVLEHFLRSLTKEGFTVVKAVMQ